jgi:hypothetical protein
MNSTFAEFIVKYGLPLILAILILATLASFFFIKFVLKKSFFDFVTEKILGLFDFDYYEIVKLDSKLNSNECFVRHESESFINRECYNLKLKSSSRIIQLPFFTRLVSYALFWTYFSLQTIFLTEILTNEQLDGYKCFNLTIKVGGKLFKCEKYALKSLDELMDAMDQIAGIIALHEINRYAFKYTFKLIKWILPRYFPKYTNKLKEFNSQDRISFVSRSQVNYILILGFLIYVIYDNLVTEYYYIPIKFVCFVVLFYSTCLSGYSAAKYSIAESQVHEDYMPVLTNLKKTLFLNIETTEG